MVEYIECRNTDCEDYQRCEDTSQNTSEIIKKENGRYTCRITAFKIPCHVIENFNNQAKILNGLSAILKMQGVNKQVRERIFKFDLDIDEF